MTKKFFLQTSDSYFTENNFFFEYAFNRDLLEIKSKQVSDNGFKNFALVIPKRGIYISLQELNLGILSSFLLFSEALINSLKSTLNFK